MSRDQHQPWSCLLGRGHGKQGEKPLPELPSLQFTIKEQRTAEDKGKAASTSCSSCGCWQELVPTCERGAIPVWVASALSVQAAKLSSKAEAKNINNKNK